MNDQDIPAAGQGQYLAIPRFEYDPSVSPPGALLRADHCIVPFHLRNRELDSLCEWAEDGRPLGIRLYTGQGGQGKSRLALELCRKLRGRGWRAGFVKSAADERIEEALDEIFDNGGPVLAVIDYAETRRNLLAPLARLVHERRQDGPFRIILLARRREEWWEQLQREEQPVGSVFAGPATRHFSLQPLATSLDERTETFHLAARAFADELGREAPKIPELDLGDRSFDSVLVLHMYALAGVEGINVQNEDGILDSTLNREKKFWSQHLSARSLPEEILPGVSRTMCTITLQGGTTDRKDTIALMKQLRLWEGQPHARLERVAGLLHNLYPGEKWVMPILPDILGEHLVERELADDPEEVFNIVLGPQEDAG